jgi:hypothetical protein
MCSWSKARKYARGATCSVPLDDEAATQARIDAGIRVVEQSNSEQSTGSVVAAKLEDTPSRKRGPQDSGKGVRLMVRERMFCTACLCLTLRSVPGPSA